MTAVKHVESYFDKRARIYDKTVKRGFIVSIARKHEDAAFLRLLGRCDGDVILDAGCGTGYHIGYYVERGAKRVVGIDVSSKMLEIAKEKFRGYNKIEFHQADIVKFEYPKKFDKIISMGVLDHIEDTSAVLDFFYARLKKNGALLVSFPNKSLFGKIYKILSRGRGIKIWNVSREEAKTRLKNAKFKVKKIVPVGFKSKIFDGLTLVCKAMK